MKKAPVPRHDAAYNPAAPQALAKKQFIPTGPMGCGLTCGYCGHEANIEDFEKSPMGLDIPEGHYQCPGCGIAWTIQREPGGYHQSNPSLPPVWVPGKKKHVLIDPML